MNLMDAKKRQKSSDSSQGLLKSFLNFLAEVKQEIQKITWTSKEELRVYTKIVVGATFLLGLGIYAIDLFIRSTFDALSVIIHWIAG